MQPVIYPRLSHIDSSMLQERTRVHESYRRVEQMLPGNGLAKPKYGVQHSSLDVAKYAVHYNILLNYLQR